MFWPLTPEEFATFCIRFWDLVVRTEDCWAWCGDAFCEYGYFWLPGVSHRVRETAAHRLAWILSNLQPVPKGKVICHHCDNPHCVRPSHLYCGTRKDNAADRKKRGSRRKQILEGRARGILLEHIPPPQPY